MSINKITLQDIALRGKRLFIRTDFNVPLDSDMNITDDTRIRATLPTINYAIDAGAIVMLASHLGRPDGVVTPHLSLAPIAKRLQRLLGKEVLFVPDCIGPVAEALTERLAPGSVLLLENLRFHPGEERNDEGFARKLADLGVDVYINEAFGTAHRNHASITGITRFVKERGCGFLMKKELSFLLKAVTNPERPFVAMLGGAKVSGKIGVIENLGNHVDKVIIGGGMAFTFLKAAGVEVGDSLVEGAMLKMARSVQQHAVDRGIKFYLPVDCIVAPSLSSYVENRRVPVQEIPKGWVGLDIGLASVHLFEAVLRGAKTILWNGPMGLFEKDAYSHGTSAMAHAVAQSDAMTIVGGGETAMAVHQAGESDNISFISTGGGATLQLLQGDELPGLAVLPNKALS